MNTRFQYLPLDVLEPSPTNPRKQFGHEDLRELGETIAQHGVIEPIIVRAWPAEYDTPFHRADRPMYEIIAGERRYRASMLAEMSDIPALIRELTTRQVLEIQIIENLQRRGVNELEEADGYRLMMQDFGYTADELAEKVGKSRAYIYGRLKLCDLAEAPRQAFLAGKIKASVALLIARIPTSELQAQATEDITEEGMSAREAAAHVQQQYMLQLERATWPLDATWPGDITLAHLPACTACPSNTSSNRELYADVAADVCTNAECFRTKRLGYLQAQAVALREAGNEVITGADARNIAPGGTEHYIHNGWMRLDKKDWLRGVHQTVEQAYGDDLATIPHTWIEDVVSGKLVECIQREQMWALDRAAKAKADPADPAGEAAKAKADPADPAGEAAKMARRAEEEAERAAADRQEQEENAFRETLMARCRDAYMAADGQTVPTEALRAIAYSMVSDLYDPGECVQEHLPAGFNIDELDDEAVQFVLYERIGEYGPAQLVALLLDLSISDNIPQARRYSLQSWQTPRALLSMAEAYGVDPDALRPPPASETPAASEPTPTPTEAPPGGEDAGGERQGDDDAGSSRTHPAVYRDSECPDMTWNGRGKKPWWVNKWLAQGGTLDQLATAAPAAPAADTETAPTPEQAAPAGETSVEKPKKQAATAASKTKTKPSGRAAAGEKGQTPDDPPAHRCPNTLDMLEARA